MLNPGSSFRKAEERQVDENKPLAISHWPLAFWSRRGPFGLPVESNAKEPVTYVPDSGGRLLTRRCPVAWQRFLGLVVLSVAGSITTASGQKTEAPDLNSLSDSELKALTISLERTGCYGSCPAYTVTIRGDGSVTYVGKNYGK